MLVYVNAVEIKCVLAKNKTSTAIKHKQSLCCFQMNDDVDDDENYRHENGNRWKWIRCK